MKRISVWLISFILLSALLIGCANRPTGGQTAAAAAEDSTFIDVPALILEFDEDGVPAMFNMPLSLLPGLDAVSLEPEMIARFTDGNVQYIQIDSHPLGMTILANGKPILGFRYSDKELRTALNALSLFMDEQNESTLAMVSGVLPLLDNLGMGIIAKFPMKAGTSPIPTATRRSYSIMSSRDLAAAESAANRRVTELPIKVAPDGSLSSTNFMFAMVGGMIPPLPMDQIGKLTEKGITEISVKTRPYGLIIGLNGNELPLMTLHDKELDNLLNFADQADLWSEYAPGLSPDILGILRSTVLPFLLGSNFNIVLTFPEAAS